MGGYYGGMQVKELAGSLDPRLCDAPAELTVATVAALGADIVAPIELGMRDIPVDEVPGVMILELRATWNPETQRYETTGLMIVTGTGTPITGTLLRRIPVDKYRHLVVRHWLMRYLGEDRFMPFELWKAGELSSRAKEGPTSENLEDVARIYWAGSQISDSPRKLVSDIFGVSSSTATNWINLARLDSNPADEGYRAMP